MKMSTRIALLTNIPAPYRLDFFRCLNARSDLKVFFDSRSEPNRQWSVPDDLGFPHTYLSGFIIPRSRHRPDGMPVDERYVQVRLGIIPALIRFKPDVVVSVEFGPRSIQAATYCAMTRKPLILWSEGTPHSEGWHSGFRRRVRRALVRRAHQFWTNGVESTSLLVSYGAEREKCREAMIGISTQRLASAVAAEIDNRATIRAEMGLRSKVLLFAGQLVERKGVKECLAALASLAPRAEQFSLLFLGDGELRPMIEAWVLKNPRFDVRLLGFRQPSEVPRYYAAADIFVMPTLDDNWSLVALEAAVAGLPQIYSRYNGATQDLLDRGAEGLPVDPQDVGQFAQALLRYLDSPPPRRSMADTASLIDFYGPEACAERAHLAAAAAVRTTNACREDSVQALTGK